MLTLCICIQMDSFFWFDTINLRQSIVYVQGIYGKFGKIKHLLSHGIPSSSTAVKTFQNSRQSLFTFACSAACFKVFFHYPHRLVFWPKVAVISSFRALILSGFSNFLICPRGGGGGGAYSICNHPCPMSVHTSRTSGMSRTYEKWFPGHIF